MPIYQLSGVNTYSRDLLGLVGPKDIILIFVNLSLPDPKWIDDVESIVKDVYIFKHLDTGYSISLFGKNIFIKGRDSRDSSELSDESHIVIYPGPSDKKEFFTYVKDDKIHAYSGYFDRTRSFITWNDFMSECNLVFKPHINRISFSEDGEFRVGDIDPDRKVKIILDRYFSDNNEYIQFNNIVRENHVRNTYVTLSEKRQSIVRANYASDNGITYVHGPSGCGKTNMMNSTIKSNHLTETFRILNTYVPLGKSYTISGIYKNITRSSILKSIENEILNLSRNIKECNRKLKRNENSYQCTFGIEEEIKELRELKKGNIGYYNGLRKEFVKMDPLSDKFKEYALAIADYEKIDDKISDMQKLLARMKTLESESGILKERLFKYKSDYRSIIPKKEFEKALNDKILNYDLTIRANGLLESILPNRNLKLEFKIDDIKIIIDDTDNVGINDVSFLEKFCINMAVRYAIAASRRIDLVKYDTFFIDDCFDLISKKNSEIILKEMKRDHFRRVFPKIIILGKRGYISKYVDYLYKIEN